jgi:hypothetical protein
MLNLALALCLQAPVAAPATTAWTQPELERAAAEIRTQIEELRGIKFKEPVAVKLADKKTFFSYAKARQDKTESPAKRARDETVAKLLGLIPPGIDYQAELLRILEDQVGGFYDPASKTFFLMDSFTGGVARIILAHELTHALDDQHFDIDGGLAKCGDDSDAAIAYMSLVEGSGTSLMNEWFLKHRADVTVADIMAAQSLGAKALAEAPPFMWKPLLAAYQAGEKFLVKTSGLNLTAKTVPLADIQSCFAAPPRSSEQVLHPKKYWDAEKRDDPIAITVDTTKLPEAWTLAGVDTLGELYLGLLTTPRKDRKGLDLKNPMSVLAVQYTNNAAEGWGGDRLVLLRRGDDAMLQLVTAWDSDKDADEFAAALGETRRPEAIPVFAGSERAASAGFVPVATATDAIVTRERSADGKVPLVVLRVFSFAGAAPSEVDLPKLALPYSVAARAQ